MISTYHLQAEIASCHTLAPNFEKTDWEHILNAYDQLIRLDPSPIIALNRVVALTKVKDAKTGLRALNKLRDEPLLQTYYPFYAVEADLLEKLGQTKEAVAALRAAMALTLSQPVGRHLEQRICDIEKV